MALLAMPNRGTAMGASNPHGRVARGAKGEQRDRARAFRLEAGAAAKRAARGGRTAGAVCNAPYAPVLPIKGGISRGYAYFP